MSQNPIRILPFGDNSSFSTSKNGEKEIKRRDTTELAPLKMVIKKAWLPVTMAPWKMVLWDGSEVQMIGRTSNWPCNRQRPPSTWGGVGNGVGNVAFWSRMGGGTKIDMTWLVGGLEHEFYFSMIGNFIIPTDELIFFRGLKPPNRWHY